jgi:MoaA/NifB/PqqE/SkfB family radical SAM enzyme
MHCSHCLFNYGNGKKGKHMPIDMFRHIMKRAYEYSSIVNVGGGEITLYDNFEQMIGILACYKSDDITPFIVTNGSITDKALLLNRLAISGIISCDLSQDPFHDPIDREVIKAFEARNAIRNVVKHDQSLLNAGRAKNLDHSYEMRKDCPCDAIQFYPTGVVKTCGCARSPIITRDVMSDWEMPDCDGCYKNVSEYA